MKTYHIKDLLNKEVLVIEMPEGSYPEITSRLLAINHSDGSIKIFKGSYTLLGKPDEIKESDAENLVDIFDMNYYADYNHPSRCAYTHTATESLLSAIETVIFWDVNPIKHPKDYPLAHQSLNWYTGQEKKFIESEQKTFDRNRSIILVKN